MQPARIVLLARSSALLMVLAVLSTPFGGLLVGLPLFVLGGLSASCGIVMGRRLGNPADHRQVRLWCIGAIVVALAVMVLAVLTYSPQPEDQSSKTGLVGSAVREEMSSSDPSADPTDAGRGVAVGAHRGDCVVVNPDSVRDDLRAAIEQDDPEINELRLSDRDILAADCDGDGYALATWNSNPWNPTDVLGDYRRRPGDRMWTEHIPRGGGRIWGPACSVPRDVAELWEVSTAHCRAVPKP